MQIIESLKELVLKDTDTLKPDTVKQMEVALQKRLKAPNLYPTDITKRSSVGQYCFNGQGQKYNPETNRVDNTIMFVDKTDGPCHGGFFRGSIHGVTDGIISFHMNNFWPQKDKKFLWWIIKDLFPDMNDNIAVVVDHSVVKNFPVAVVLLDINKQDMDYFGNFLITSRLVSQWNCAAVWTRLVSWGVIPELAMLLSLQMDWCFQNNPIHRVSGKNYEGSLTFRSTVIGDIPFHRNVSLKRLMEKDYVRKSPEVPASTGRLLIDNIHGGRSNYIWNGGNLKHFENAELVSVLIPYILKNDQKGAIPVLDKITRYYIQRG